jgi:hypothetical protein
MACWQAMLLWQFSLPRYESDMPRCELDIMPSCKAMLHLKCSVRHNPVSHCTMS